MKNDNVKIQIESELLKALDAIDSVNFLLFNSEFKEADEVFRVLSSSKSQLKGILNKYFDKLARKRAN